MLPMNKKDVDTKIFKCVQNAYPDSCAKQFLLID